MLPQRFAHDVEPTRERRIAEAAPAVSGADGAGSRGAAAQGASTQIIYHGAALAVVGRPIANYGSK